MIDYAAVICEIFNGYSEIEYHGEVLFLRHINIFDQKNYSDSFERQKKRALDNSVPLEKERLEFLTNEGFWSEKKEMEIETIRSYLENLVQSKKQLDLKSQKDALQKTIDEEQRKLSEILAEKRSLMGKTAEDFAHTWANEEFIRHLVYKDCELKSLAFSEEDFNQIEPEDLAELVNQYHAVSERINDDKIQEAVLSDSFSLYLGRIDSQNFFSRPISKLSKYQLMVLAYGKMFLNIFQNVENIPERIKKSPKELLDFVDSQKKRQDKQSKGKKVHQNMGIVGATKEDLEALDPEAKKVDIAGELKKRGGKMSMEDFAQIANR